MCVFVALSSGHLDNACQCESRLLGCASAYFPDFACVCARTIETEAIRECKFAQRIKHMRNEDFLAIIQDVMYKKMQPGVCSILADNICLELGGKF